MMVCPGSASNPEPSVVAPATVILALAALMLPAMLTGDWHRDRCLRIVNGETDGWRPTGNCESPPGNPPNRDSAGVR